MKKHLLKTLLVATGLLAGSVNSWGDTKDLTPIQTTRIQSAQANVVMYNASATTWECSQSKISRGAFSAQDGYSYPGPIILTKFDASSTLEGKQLQKATLSITSKCNVSGKNSNVQVAKINTGWDATTATWTNTNTGDVLNAINIDENKNGVNINTKSTTFTINVTDYLKATTDKNIGFAIYTYTARAQLVSSIKLSLEYIDASAAANYTIKYIDANGNELKASTTATGTSGQTAELTDENKTVIYNSDKSKKYIYSSDDTQTNPIAADGSTVISVKFREAETWNYTINCKAGNTTKTITGKNFEGETFNIAYPYVINDKGTLYTAKKKLSSDGKGYYFSFTLSENNQEKNDIEYAIANKDNIVYLEEAEDIEGLTKATNEVTAIRSSMGGSAYAKDNDVTITKLPAGKYKLYACFCDATTAKGTVWNFLAGSENIFTFTTSVVNWQEGESNEFTLKEETPIILAQGGSAKTAIDYLYIQKLGEVANVTAAKYATYVTSGAVKVPANAKVMTAKVENNKLVTTTLSAGTVIPANTAIIVNAEEAGDVSFEMAGESGSMDLANDLQASTGEGVTADGTTQYCLTEQDGKVGFGKVKAGVVIPAGKAYLVVKEQAAANFFAFDGTVTAIKNVETSATADGAYYTLQGVKVEKPTKGIYVHNGKKVVIK